MSTGKRWRLARAGSALALSIALGACDGVKGADDSRLAAYADATLTAGVGWGDLRLEQTTLGEIAQRFGKGNANLIATSEIGLEVAFEQGQVSFLFRIDPACCPGPPDLRAQPGVKDLWDWAQATPCMREQKLASISVCARYSEPQPFFRGTTDKGTRLLAAAPAEVTYGRPGAHPARMLAGEMVGSPGQGLYFPSGISFFADGTAGGSIRRITLYAPGK